MKGYSHAISGALVWTAATSAYVPFAPYVQDTSTVLAGALLTAGAAILADSDHPEGTISYSLPSVKVLGITLVPSPTRLLAKGVHAISGGHRHGTHSLIGIAVFTALAFLAPKLIIPVYGRPLPVLALLYMILLAAYASKATGFSRMLGGAIGGTGGTFLRSWLGPWIVALVFAGWVAWTKGGNLDWLPVSVCIGMFMHILGDMLTVEGVPWLWPWNPKPPVPTTFWHRNGYFAFPVLGHTESMREHVFAFVMALVLVLALTLQTAYGLGHPLADPWPGWWGQLWTAVGQLRSG